MHPHADSPADPVVEVSAPEAIPAVCFDEGTSEDYVAEWTARLAALQGSLDYQIGDRWSHTALDPNTGGQGDPVRITYSFIPDGVMISPPGGAPQPSQLFGRMNQLFNGDQALWQSKIAEVFARWSELSGLSYQQVSDDGAAFGPGSPGVVGVRGDVRIGSVVVDGSSGVLAYNYFPDIGDMVLDAAENWASPQGNHIFLRNIVAHEHGHGWGLSHVCPANSTKLLEPYYSGAFNGPQHDDIRAVQRNYGDNYEPNDNPGAAAGLGTLNETHVLDQVSLDDNSDADFFTFTAPPDRGFTLVLSPVGMSYLDGPQNNDGSCSSGSPVNTSDDQNLDLYLRNADGGLVLAQSNDHPAGASEVIYRYLPPAQGGTYMVEITGAQANTIQLYRLVIELFNAADPYWSVSPLDFDTTQLEMPVTLPAVVRNSGSQTRNVSSISVIGSFTVAPTGAHAIAPGDSLVLAVTYLASAPGTQYGTLTVTHDGPGGTLEGALIGTAVNSSLQFINGPVVNFGDVPVFTTDSAATAIRAQGNVPVTILNVTAAAPFGIQLQLPLTLNPTQALVMRPRFTPTEEGAADGYLVITHTAISSPDTIYLHGTGTPNLSAPESPDELPLAYRLGQNYPNPFNPSTTIAFDLPRASRVRLQVFNVEGRLVTEVVNAELSAGRHAVPFDGAALPSGMYIYRLTTPDFSDMAKMILMK